MKIVSWNVNGLRAVHRNGYWEKFLKLDPDIFCLQETKAHPDQLPDEVREVKGYHSFFSWSQVKKGYSGTAIYTREKPLKVKYGMGIKKFDQEGRIVEAHFKDFVLLNVYFPNGGGGPVRLAYKLDFYDEFLMYIQNLRKEGKSVIFCGDVNTAHEAIDLARSKENEKNTGFLPIERAWIDEVINAGYTDIFRHFYPNKADAYSYWDMKTRARDRNVGWRIDYFFVSNNLIPRLKSANILDNVYGSDHCPIIIELK
ncbi:MAG: exodeoxyribonuclease III [Candidatus Pacebacteria bacterium]|nr:exodeoxyribonuclease III [Candidatus Paceibacterota bacterium]